MQLGDKEIFRLPAPSDIDVDSLLAPDARSVSKIAEVLFKCKEENTLANEKAKVVVFPPYDKKLQPGLSGKEVKKHLDCLRAGNANLDVRPYSTSVVAILPWLHDNVLNSKSNIFLGEFVSIEMLSLSGLHQSELFAWSL